jgi:hypothetical protein
MRSAAVASRDFAAAHTCLRNKRTPAGSTQVLRSPLPAIEVNGEREHVHAPQFVFYRDRFSFVVRAAEIVLNIESAPRPPHTGVERRLLLLLNNRAEAHKL